FVRALAMELEIPVYVVKLTMASNENKITNMLIPDGDNSGDEWDEDGNQNLTSSSDFKLVLLEDFDRYLKDNHSSMSSILNALDGIFPSFGVIRFFSANTTNIISKNKALQTRLNRIFYFDKPNKEQFIKQVENVYYDK